VHDFTLHTKPTIPILSEMFFRLPTCPEKRLELGTFYNEIVTDKEIAKR